MPTHWYATSRRFNGQHRQSAAARYLYTKLGRFLDLLQGEERAHVHDCRMTHERVHGETGEMRQVGDLDA